MIRFDPLRHGLSDPAGRSAMPLDGPTDTGNARLAGMRANGQPESAEPSQVAELGAAANASAAQETACPERVGPGTAAAQASASSGRPDLVTWLIAAAVFA